MLIKGLAIALPLGTLCWAVIIVSIWEMVR